MSVSTCPIRSVSFGRTVASRSFSRDFTAELLARPTNVALQKDAIYFANLGKYHIGRIEHPSRASGRGQTLSRQRSPEINE